MNIYITAGTYDFLKSIKKKYPLEKMILMENENGALLLHETLGETVFKEPRKYDILEETGSIEESGFVAMNNIPVTDEGRPIFEYQFKNKDKQIETAPGFLAIKILRPLTSNTYILMTVWNEETAFKNWKASSSFIEAFGSKNTDNVISPQTKIFSSASYVSKYTISE